jgi:PS-10 peptidase S37
MRRTRLVLFVSSLLLIAATLRAQETNVPQTELYLKLKALPGVVEVTPTASRGGRGNRGGGGSNAFKENYTIIFEQLVDHQNPTGQKFRQKVYLSHADYDKPMLLETEGYAANGNGGGELQRILEGNVMTVEHRYFGQSVPKPTDWQYMCVKQAADDMHVIVSELKTIYHGKWVASGTSKGGQTSLFYKCYYPDDVDATVAYVAPVNVTQEDPRINHFIETVGDAETRKKIKDFQIALFQREDEILPLIKEAADQRNWTFDLVNGLPAAYEYGVLEYPYAFWQYGTKPSAIPAPDAPAATLAAHYNQVGTLRYYSDQGRKPFEPFMYEAFSEIGYYNYDITDFKQYMKSLKDPSNQILAPPGVKITFHPETMSFVYNYLQYHANHVIYVYGETDAWSATQMQLIGRTDAVKFVVAGSDHRASVRLFSPEQKELFYSTLDGWLGIKVNRN